MKDSILVIRFSAMGDVAMTVPVILALREHYPDVKITFVTKKHFVPIIGQIPGVQVIGVDLKEYKGLKGLYKLFRSLKSEGFTAVADLHNVVRTKVLKFFFLFTNTPVFQIDKGRKEKKALTRQNNKLLKPLKHTTARYAEVFEKAGYSIPVEKFPKLPAKTGFNFPEGLNLNSRDKKVGVAPFAAHRGKEYPLELTARLVTELSQIPSLKLFLLGSPAESAVLEKWAQEIPNTINIAGKANLETELALISHLDVLIGMDSGNGHLAAMYGIPVITIWGVTHPDAGFAPYGQEEDNQLTADLNLYPAIPTSIYGNSYPKGYEEAIETISPDQVVNRVCQLLKL